MNPRILVQAAFLIALGAPSLARAEIVTQHLGGDAQADSVLPRSHVVFVAEGRTSDGLNPTFELDLGPSTTAPAVTSKHKWQSGRVEPFAIVYDPSSNMVAFGLGGHTLAYSPVLVHDVTDIMIRVHALSPGSSVSIGSIEIGDVPIDDSCQSIAVGSDNLWIRGASLSQGFQISGRAVFSWGPLVSTTSGIAFQVEVGQSIAAPTPDAALDATWGHIKTLHQ